ncbi:MAG TPA: hypothetical protein VNB64_12870, partial [Solirubrobacteraceae bacterium]|nr:hypothetical protein [Solirubrobacteraceae bacterium]
MRIGFHDPFTGAPGGGERYLFTMLAEAAASLPEAELAVLSPEPPDPAGWRAVGVAVDPGAFAWRPTPPAGLTAHSGDLDLLVTLTADVPV